MHVHLGIILCWYPEVHVGRIKGRQVHFNTVNLRTSPIGFSDLKFEAFKQLK